MEINGGRNIQPSEDVMPAPTDVLQQQHHQQTPQQQSHVPDIANHELSLARQMVFDQQMLAVARQMMELQQGAASMGGGDPAAQIQSLNLYPTFRGISEVDSISSNRAPSIASSDVSLSDVSRGGVGGGVGVGGAAAGARGGPMEGNTEHFSASEQRQWQRLQRQFDKAETVCQDSDKTVGEFTLPFSPDSS